MDEAPSFYLTVVAFSFTTEGGELDDPHRTETWRFEYYPKDNHSLPLENTIFVQYKRNESTSNALENKLLDAEEELKEGLVIDEVKKLLQRDIPFFTIENSMAIPIPPPRINIRSNFRTIPYASLEPFGASRPDLMHRIVKHNGIPYLLKTANFPHDEVVLSQEVKNYRLLKRSNWVAELGGIVERQGRKEAILVRYYSAGDLTRHFGAVEKTKGRWVKQLATALKELDKLRYIPQDLKCANLVIDDSDNVRLIDLENFGGTDGWAHPNDIRGFIPAKGSVSERKQCYAVYGFGKTVLELYVGKAPTDEEDLKKTPQWVQELVKGCIEGKFRSAAEVVNYMETLSLEF